MERSCFDLLRNFKDPIDVLFYDRVAGAQNEVGALPITSDSLGEHRPVFRVKCPVLVSNCGI
jgi:hypothetical protein